METAELKYNGIGLKVEYKLEGRNLPSTQIDPPEYLYAVVEEIYAIDSEVKIIGLLTWEQIEEIETILTQKYEI